MSDGNIVRLTNRVEDGDPPDEHMIRLCEWLLDKARRGELNSLAYAGRDGMVHAGAVGAHYEVFHVVPGRGDFGTLLGDLLMVTHKIEAEMHKRFAPAADYDNGA